MVTVPATTARLSTGPANVTLDPGIARGTAFDIGGSMFKAASTVAAFVEKQQAARSAGEVMRANTAATRELDDLAYETERAGDTANGVATFEQKANEIISRQAGSIQDETARARFQYNAGQLFESKRVGLRNSLFKQESDQYLSDLDLSIEDRAARAAMAGSDLELQAIQKSVAHDIAAGADAGYYDPKRKVNLWQGFKSRTQEARARPG